jgi:hypothetical protein
MGQTPQAVLAGLAERARQPAWQWPAVTLWVLGGVLLVEVIGMVLMALREMPVIDVNVPVVAAPAAQAEPVTLSGLPSLSQGIRRVLFVPPPQPRVVEEKGDQAAKVAEALRSKLSLKGIITGNPPQAILEDGAAGKTFFVVPGQALSDGAVVEAVTESSVTIRVDTETFMLNL